MSLGMCQVVFVLRLCKLHLRVLVSCGAQLRFLMLFKLILSMSKSTNTVLPTYLQFIQTPITETKFGILCILTNL